MNNDKKVFLHCKINKLIDHIPRVIVLPFNDIPDLLSNTDFPIIVTPGTSFEDAFKTAKNPDWQAAWIYRVQPYLKSNIGITKTDRVKMLSEDSTSAIYENYFSIM